MKMSDWAEREVKLACKRETPDRKDGEFDYGCACYESALKAYKCLCEDGHSGASFYITKNILDRLMAGMPLTPIEGNDDDWRYSFTDDDEGEVYQCVRMSCLFKTVLPDGSVEYHANNYHCVDEGDKGWYFGCGARDLLEEYTGPIQMPYYPPLRQYEIHTRTYLSDRKHGDFDTKEYLYIVFPNGERIDVNRYFGETDEGWRELNKEEFETRKKMHEERLKAEQYGDV